MLCWAPSLVSQRSLYSALPVLYGMIVPFVSIYVTVREVMEYTV